MILSTNYAITRLTVTLLLSSPYTVGPIYMNETGQDLVNAFIMCSSTTDKNIN